MLKGHQWAMWGRDVVEDAFFVDPDIAKAETLPAYAFEDPDVLSLELKTLFSKAWLLVPESSSGQDSSRMEFLKSPGSRVPFSILDRQMFLQRSRSGELGCFPNVCTHAWHTLVESPSSGGSIVCPQHGRRFNEDGRFLSQAGFENLENFPREEDHLRRIDAASLGQFLFICLEQPQSSFQSLVGELQKSIPGIDLAMLDRKTVGNELREVEGNWKQHAWNYMDNYHIRFVHKGPGGLADAVDLSSYKTELHSRSALQWVYARDPKYGLDPKLLADRFRDPKDPGRRVFALWWFLFPNLALNFYPWGLSVNLWMPVPGRPDRTMFYWYHYSLDDEKFRRRNEIWLDEQVDAEDIEAIGEVAKGVRSGFAPRGRFIPGDEAGPHWFHRLVFESIFQD